MLNNTIKILVIISLLMGLFFGFAYASDSYDAYIARTEAKMRMKNIGKAPQSKLEKQRVEIYNATTAEERLRIWREQK